VLPIADRHTEYAWKVAEELRGASLRAEVDERSESIGRKIRDAELQKAPYMLVVGDKEAESGTVGVRRHREGDIGSMTVEEFGALAAEEVATKAPRGVGHGVDRTQTAAILDSE
jgi:threonyl-tRNA synthetase